MLGNKDLEKISNRSIVDEHYGDLPTLIISPSECYDHLTGPSPSNLSRNSHPSENIFRLDVLTQAGKPKILIRVQSL